MRRSDWTEDQTSTHQDHVVAHVIGATVQGYFVLEEAIHLVLDMGFIWTVYLDCQMALLPIGVALAELQASANLRNEIDNLSAGNEAELTEVIPRSIRVEQVALLKRGDDRMLLLSDGEHELSIVPSLEELTFSVS